MYSVWKSIKPKLLQKTNPKKAIWQLYNPDSSDIPSLADIAYSGKMDGKNAQKTRFKENKR